jgi:hypothetical protein
MIEWEPGDTLTRAMGKEKENFVGKMNHPSSQGMMD